jgi:Flp pilus assembly protein TadD
VNLGLLYMAQQRPVDAEAALRMALELDPRFAPAAVNLADLYRPGRRPGPARRAGTGQAQRRRPSCPRPAARAAEAAPEAIAELEAAARLVPENARYGYVYAVALHDTGRPQQAQAALAQVLARHPHDRPTLSALVGYALERGDAGRALEHARRLAELEPSNSDVRRLVERLTAEQRR